MKCLKMFVLAAMAATSLMALTVSMASATTLDGPSGTLKKGTAIDLSQTSSRTAQLHVGSTVLDECTGGTIEGVTLNETGAAIFLSVTKANTTWSGCSKTTDTLAGGELSFESSSGGNGTVKAIGFEITVNTIFGSCVYGFGSTTKTLGTLVGGSPATLAISTSVPKISGLCPSEATLTGFYNVTSPTTVTVTN